MILALKMSTRRNGVSRCQRVENIRGEGPNWILIAGGALLSTLSIRFGYKLKRSLDSKQQANTTGGLKVNGASDRRSSRCCLHSNVPSCVQNDDHCLHCIPGTESAEGKHAPKEQMGSASNSPLPLVTVHTPEFNKESGIMWVSSPDRLELPPKPFNHHSTCSDSPCVSECGSDIFIKREVIQKLRQQLKRRDDMILEMQDQILELQNSLSAQMAHSSHLQGQLEATNRDLFGSEREVQRLRKAFTDQCVGYTGSNGKASPVAAWGGHTNGFMDGGESNSESPEKGLADGERIDMLRREVGELKEVIEGKEYLLHSYKEQKGELLLKVKELQQRLDLQLPNIL
ncbi:PREDICTED: uncharacterized protein LOC104823796 isoform X2 [Tarenaya hassleriana]|uniref:uncharacterized protein LOC104823796 isoform X2 n=1 Tax=Tarenaya hassleriana TaxID=28532 RepID=UPI00053C7B87|nr:PREDICTED: uncharacterized protein LOC104823796 isoform X2 [Tarenaya hassleriana]